MHAKNLDALDTAKNELLEALKHQQSAASDLSHKIDSLRSAGSVIATSNRILESLLFPEIHMRHSAIHEAYKGTFSWVFEDSASPFRTWLESSSGMFWISGKAGSGKSTLMKFITGQAQTKTLLQKWAGGSEIVVASYSFWSAGYAIQKTQQGLLQSLLFQILRQCPDLIPTVAPKQWQQHEFSHALEELWTRQELSHAMNHAILRGGLHSRFCFSIDGLDEYAGDHWALIQDLDHLTKGNNIKICVSSRPWNAFRSAYGIHGDRLLKLQDRTKHDMRKYVNGMFEEDQRFRQLAQTDDGAKDLVEEIQERAQGVFLWVYLVVRSLRRGLTEVDDIAMLRRRLQALPIELEDYFRHMLDSIDRIYQEHTATTLQIVVCALSPLPSALFSYLTMELDNPDWVLQSRSRTVSADVLRGKQDYVALCINKWCKDLLEINYVDWTKRSSDILFNVRVDYLHRTVRDYLMTEEVQNLLRSRGRPEFNPRTTLCRLLVGLGKDFEESWAPIGADSLNTLYEIITTALSYANFSELLDDMDTSAVLSELDKAVTRFFKRYSAFLLSAAALPRFYDASSHWTASFSPYELRDYNAASFPAFALSFGVQSPLKAWLRDRAKSLTSLEADMLLICVLLPFYEHANLVQRPRNQVELAEQFLKQGANVNHTVSEHFRHDRTIWAAFVASVAALPESEIYANIVPLTRLLMEHGASPQGAGAQHDGSSPLQVLLEHCAPEERADLQKVFLMAEKSQRNWFSWDRFGWK